MKILIVEDNPDSRLLLRKMLEGTGHEVTEAVHGLEALDNARHSPPELIISDILMPVMDGFKLCYEVKNDPALKEIPFIFYTATYVDLEDERLAMGLGASRYIIKPMDPAEFLKIIEEVLKDAESNELLVPYEPIDDPPHLFRKYDASISKKLSQKVRELDLYQKVFTSTLDGVLITNSDGVIREQNPSLAVMFGYSSDDLSGRTPALFLGNDVYRQGIAGAGRGTPVTGACETETRDGTRIMVDYSVAELHDERGQIIALVWTIMDTTRRCEAEAGQKLFRSLVDASNDAIFVIDAQSSRLIDVNQRACLRLGYSRDELLGMRVIDLDFNFTDMGLWGKHLVELDLHPETLIETQHRRKDGSVFPVEVSIVRTREAGEDLIMAVARDITERQESEARELAFQREWEKTFDAIDDIVTLQDKDMRITRVNRATSRVFNIEPSRLLGRRCYEIFREEREPCEGCPIPHALKNFESYTAEIEHKNLDKTFMVTASPILDEYGEISSIAHFARDITEQKSLTTQLLQVQKLEAIGILAGGVAHDFNNMLTAILGYLELAMGRMEPGEPVMDELRQVESAANRATNLVRQLLLFSRKQPMEFISLNLNKSIAEVLKMLQRIIGEDIKLETEFDPECWEISGDPTNIDQVIMNLAVNARDAMPSGGRLTIRTQNVALDREYCKVYPESRPGEFICVTVADSGQGMTDSVLKQIFVPFFSTKGEGRGTGLGLAVVYGIIKSHRGWINVYSEPGLGTSFKIYLPRASEVFSEQDKEQDVGFATLQGKGERILVVEDDKPIRNLIANALQRNGYSVKSAGNAEEAIEIFGGGGNFDLVATDVVMPGMTGLELADRLLAITSGLPILVWSGYTDKKSQWLRIKEKGFSFLEKPFLMKNLLQTVKDLLKD
ncbi:MAG: PAS domain S-box protein [Proteobacteria bacterium]|nr:PAS domain S-box protein [Pseudomonadota bacterium]MBU1708976.1 PAS domain S-box protein [Pseudomonadota bacterium]